MHVPIIDPGGQQQVVFSSRTASISRSNHQMLTRTLKSFAHTFSMIDYARLGDFASSQKAIILCKNVLLKVTWDSLEPTSVE